MIQADGKVEDEEVFAAEKIGKDLFENFDSTDFREVIHSVDSLSDPHEICSILKGMLKPKAKRQVIRYLETVANSDSEFDDKEKELLDTVKEIFNS